MKAQDLLNFYETLESESVSSIFSKLANLSDESGGVGDYMNRMAGAGQKITIDKMGKEKAGKLLNAIRLTLLSNMSMQGYGTNLLVAEINDELKIYTDTIVLAALGVFMDEEVV